MGKIINKIISIIILLIIIVTFLWVVFFLKSQWGYNTTTSYVANSENLCVTR